MKEPPARGAMPRSSQPLLNPRSVNTAEIEAAVVDHEDHNNNDKSSDERLALLTRPLGNQGTNDGTSTRSSAQPTRRSVAARVAANLGAAVAIAGMIFSWVGSGELVQGLTVRYPHPFAICYVTRLSWCVLLIGWAAWRWWHYPAVAPPAGELGSPLGPFEWRHYVKMASVLSMVGLISGYTWYVSLDHTPLPSNTAVYQTAPVIVFAISVPVLGEKVTVVKVCATATCVVGAILVSMGKGSGGSSGSGSGDSTHITREGFGFAMCALSTFLYACFEVAYKRLCTDDNDPVKVANAFRFIGLIGAMVVLGTPLFPIFHYTGVETFAWPSWDAAR
jgi:drug/metabolite transporter (DMT)-like permease